VQQFGIAVHLQRAHALDFVDDGAIAVDAEDHVHAGAFQQLLVS